ncbi:BON domain-containing protein [Pseudahrensia aquimaris]|uniref:BON domain-containing protein n=1 Tax=Pseudahrensia aquimaris TaxID=744461 RepID=A0ABW3FCZ0_9HYPH
MIRDSDLKRLVLDELQWDPKVDHAHIGVTVADGSVTLLGHVSSYATRFAALDAVKRVRGVKAIGDEIEVNIPTEHRHDDSDIAEHIAHVLEWNVSIPDGSVIATVQNGFVTLSGEVDHQHQREHIEKQVEHVGSVTGIANRIRLKPKATAENVKEMIENALQRNAELEAKNVSITVSGDTVTLDGKVKAYYEREIAERAAWTAPGVKNVIDHLAVG